MNLKDELAVFSAFLQHRPELSCYVFFALIPEQSATRTRLQMGRHRNQLFDTRTGSQLALWSRSAFGLIPVYNNLPDQIATNTTVASLQKLLKKRYIH